MHQRQRQLRFEFDRPAEKDTGSADFAGERSHVRAFEFARLINHTSEVTLIQCFGSALNIRAASSFTNLLIYCPWPAAGP